MRLRGNPLLKALDRWLLGTAISSFGWIKSKPRLSDPPGSVLLIKLNALGDTILFVALARVLKRTYPEVRVEFLGSEINLPVLQRCPYLDAVQVCRLSDVFRKPLTFLNVIRQIQRNRYDVIIDGSQWERITALITLFSRAKATVGFDTAGQKRSGAYHFPIPHRREQHEIDCFFELLQPLGIMAQTEERGGIYVVQSEDREKLRNVYDPLKSQIVFHPGCGAHGAPRQWLPQYYSELAERLAGEFPDHHILLTGSTDETETCASVKSNSRNEILDLCGKLDFHQLAALLEQAALLICGNTGVMHLAAAIGTPVIALHGPTDPRRWGPLSKKATVIISPKECAPCLYLGSEYACDCPDCMAEIPVAGVFQACCIWLNLNSRPPKTRITEKHDG
ncbi:MAG: glycosyltransferase family 9 protein [bacterium]